MCHLSSNGDTHFEILADSYEIEVPKGWVKYIKAGAADGGYISKGLYKYCISVRLVQFEPSIEFIQVLHRHELRVNKLHCSCTSLLVHPMN